MDTEELISCIFVKNTLWDRKVPQHHNRFILDKLWDAAAEEMKSTSTGIFIKDIIRYKLELLFKLYSD